MFRLLIMCLLGLSGVFFETSVTQALPMVTPTMEMMSMTNDVEGLTAKSKRHDFHPAGTPCPQLSLSHSASLSGHYEATAYQKPFVIPSYHQIPKIEPIGYQKPVVPKIIYQTIPTPAIHHDSHNVQPIVKQHVQYVQQPTYVPFVKEQPISYMKPVAPAVSYGNVQKLIAHYVKPIQHVQPIQTIHPLKTYAKEIPCENGPAPAKVIEKPVMETQPYYAKQFFQPVSYYPKPVIQPKPISIYPPRVNNHEYLTTKVIYKKPETSIIKIPSASEPGCEKIHQPQISYVKAPQPIRQNVHQPIFQYAPQYHPHVQQPMFHFEQKIHQPLVQQPMVHIAQKIHQPVVPQPLYYFTQKIHQPEIVQQPIVHLAPKIHQPIAKNPVIHYQQPIAYGHAQHSVAPPMIYHGQNYQSPIIPCHK